MDGMGGMDGFVAGQALVSLAILALFFWFYVRIIRKAGYSGWWVLILLVPVVNLVMLWVFAFADWPALRRRASPPTERGAPPSAGPKPAAEPVVGRPARDAEPPRRAAGPAEGGTMVQGRRPAVPRAEAPLRPPASWVLSGFDGNGQAIRLSVTEDALRAAEGGLVLGRLQDSADLFIGDDSVSRRHALLRLKSGDLAIEDLGSANGTVVDGREVRQGRPVPLDPGAEIELGAVRLTVTKG